MKLFTFKVIVILGILLVAPMFIPGPNGKPIMSLDDWIPRDLISFIGDGINSVEGTITSRVDSAGDSASSANQVYTWRDEQGVLHYSDTPIQGAETIAISENTLEIPAEHFVEHGMVPADSAKRSGPRSVLMEDDRFRQGSSKTSGKSEQGAHLSDIDALVNGDFSNAAGLLQNLPALLEHAKQARQMEPESR